MFLAIASIKDNSDINQWFIIDNDVYVNMPKNTWFKSTKFGKGLHVGTQIDPCYCHKATLEEIIEHFKK